MRPGQAPPDGTGALCAWLRRLQGRRLPDYRDAGTTSTAQARRRRRAIRRPPTRRCRREPRDGRPVPALRKADAARPLPGAARSGTGSPTSSATTAKEVVMDATNDKPPHRRRYNSRTGRDRARAAAGGAGRGSNTGAVGLLVCGQNRFTTPVDIDVTEADWGGENLQGTACPARMTATHGAPPTSSSSPLPVTPCPRCSPRWPRPGDDSARWSSGSAKSSWTRGKRASGPSRFSRWVRPIGSSPASRCARRRCARFASSSTGAHPTHPSALDRRPPAGPLPPPGRGRPGAASTTRLTTTRDPIGGYVCNHYGAPTGVDPAPVRALDGAES